MPVTYASMQQLSTTLTQEFRGVYQCASKARVLSSRRRSSSDDENAGEETTHRTSKHQERSQRPGHVLDVVLLVVVFAPCARLMQSGRPNLTTFHWWQEAADPVCIWLRRLGGTGQRGIPSVCKQSLRLGFVVTARPRFFNESQHAAEIADLWASFSISVAGAGSFPRG